ncbi:MAG: M20/M25/M40 family metallo-hydrolase [Chloroflexota bacterium]|nr:M20/M25/M40 family metallo-hydrolase [Chloroflexota bacterium]
MDKPRNGIRRALIALIIVLVLVQAGILAYMWTLRRPSVPQDAAEPAPLQFQWPSVSTATPDETHPTPAPGAAEIVVGPLVPATDYTALARVFDEERALAHLAHLASDELGGRQPGTPGGQATGDYIAARFAEYGLQPAGSDSAYFQTFTVPYGQIAEPPILTIIPPNRETLTHNYAYRTDYCALTGGYLGMGEGEGPVVWLNECLGDAYAGHDLVGKIVLCRYTGNPEVYRQAIEHQVGGLLLLDREREGEPFRRGGYRETAWVVRTIPAYLISETVAQDLLIGTDYTLDDLSLRFAATPLSTTVRIAVTVEEQDEVEARNVLGFLPGSDPEWSDEVVVIGAHYDHLGHEPDGAIMSGANDNGSGVAAMLEIARLWQAQDFSPARSVLFAAWDGEEQGLLGSQHYVQHPSYPLTCTIAMLNLDMVGAGEALRIDGEGAVAAQLQASAEVYGISTTLQLMGRSDHVSFHEARVPAAMLIWWPDIFYHTPDDKVEVVEPEKLKTVGVLSAHTLAALAEGYVELEQAVARLQASVALGDREAFLAGLDSTDPDLRAAQATWFDNLWSRELAEVTIEPARMRVGDGEADVTLRLTYRWADATRREPSVSYDVRFVQRDGAWAFAGYELDELSGDVVTVARFPSTALGTGSSVSVETHELLSTTQRAYLTLAADLGFQPITGTRFIYYPDGATMRAIARPAAGSDTRWLVSSAGLAEIAWGEPITPALVNLALNQMGLPPHVDEGAWLREGLALHYEGGAESKHLSTLTASDAFTSLLDFPALDGLSDREAQVLRAQAWSGTAYLLDRHGADGLRALCAAWDAPETGAGSRNRAFQQALGLSPDQFEAAWRADRLAPLRADAEAIQATIAARVEAVVEGNETGFLSTVTLADPVLRAEERNWFADLADHPVLTYSVAGELIGWSPDRGEATVALSVESGISGGQSIQVVYDARFVREGGRWLYAGVAWDQLASEHFVLKYDGNNHDGVWAQHTLGLAEAAYARVTADLGATLSLPQEIKVYDDVELFRTSVSLSLPDWTTSWTGPGESIKIWLQVGSESALQRAIAGELARQVLFAQGYPSPLAVEAGGSLDWLHEGVANFEAGRVLPLGAHRMAAEYSFVVQEAARHHKEFPLYSMPPWEDVPDDQASLFRAQSWSVVSFIVEQHGLPGLRRFITQSISSQAGTGTRPTDDTAANLHTALGVDPESFLAEWQEYTLVAGVPDDLVSLARRFPPERALAHVAILSSPEFSGREAGAPGADLAAAYIAEQFASLGLQPLGGPLTGTAWLGSSSSGVITNLQFPGAPLTRTETGGLDYLQQFPISYTHLISVPTLILLDADGTGLYEFTYRQDFLESAGEGIAEGELVWVHAEDLEGMHFGGAVVLERDVDDPITRAVQLQDHGAGGLIVATDKESRHFQMGRVRQSGGYGDSLHESEVVIPVFEITGPAFEILLEQLGIRHRDLSFAPPAFPLGIQVQQSLVRSPITTTLTANVLGLLPGDDPDLADEILIVGAHYDHIGQSQDGLYFPGANRNASGVGVLLETILVWQSAGYRPARSVLFVAWGAEELDSAGVTHYLAHPVLSLTQTVGVIALDSIGNGRGYQLLFYGTQGNDRPLMHQGQACTAELNRRAQRRVGTGEGWHTLFNSTGIPTIKFIWDEAEKDFYLPTDTADRIDPDRLAFGGEILTLLSSWLAGR